MRSFGFGPNPGPPLGGSQSRYGELERKGQNTAVQVLAQLGEECCWSLRPVAVAPAIVDTLALQKLQTVQLLYRVASTVVGSRALSVAGYPDRISSPYSESRSLSRTVVRKA